MDKSEDEESPSQTTSESHILSLIFDRKVTCPVCSENITVKAVKSAGIRVISRDSDTMIYYQEPNPSFYDVWFCPLCGYAAISSKFNDISEKQKSLIKEKISSKWKINKDNSPIYDVNKAIEVHKLGLLSTIVKEASSSEKAMICLKLAWLYRISKNTEHEIKFLAEAKNSFMLAYEEEEYPISGMDESTLQYLIGELFRRIGDEQNALQWFGKVLGDRNAKQRIKDMARDQKDLMFKET